MKIIIENSHRITYLKMGGVEFSARKFETELQR
jgi:hypothetical protein